jgi:hypothetical protein
MRFSEKMGLVPAFDHKSGMPDGLRNRLWNVVYDQFRYFDDRRMSLEEVERKIWSNAFKQPLRVLDGVTNPDFRYLRVEMIEKVFLEASWNQVYDAIQMIGEYRKYDMKGFRESCNTVFAEEGAPYRFVNDQILPSMSEQEAAEVAQALRATEAAGNLSGVHEHLQSAGAKLGGRPPDFRNSIKESVSAVEAMIRNLLGASSTLGDGLKELERSGFPVHPALVRAYPAIYGYASDADGVRHSLETDSIAAEDLEDLAVYMYVSCSAFVSLLIKQARKAGRL